MSSISRNRTAHIFFQHADQAVSAHSTLYSPHHMSATDTLLPVPTPRKQLWIIISGLVVLHGAVYYWFNNQEPTKLPVIDTPVVVEITKPEPPKPIEPPKPVEPPRPLEQKVAPEQPKPLPQQPVVQNKPEPKPVTPKMVTPAIKAPATPVQQTVETPKISEPVQPAPAPAPVEEKVTGAKGYIGYLNNPAPTYPEEAIDRGWEGTVLMSVRVSPEGKALDVQVKKSSGKKLLDTTAVNTVKRWAFVPAKQGSQNIEGVVDVPLTFKLPN
ncbi:hypothetical protein A3K93_13450 (plasmid) [Acinetobacter sp. NCu2D-2]|uniref:energy transducer TonB n=1 Tax=Acinetobacter sp. NCu2D-2 TaxID=1608473 RepID=UPI0007CDE5B0|nr:energy transducer TonB [Acinetobacter sp. NCu2D-2]ANF83246.1 hypothetical protein A3K93_13450 [Acinetobacter sp. NCu2D-2]